VKGRPDVRPPESDQELRELLDHAAVGLSFIDTDGRVLWANQTELNFMGFDQGEYVGRHLAESLVDPEVASDLLGRLSRREPVSSYEARMRARDGSIKQVLIDGSSFFRDGEFAHSRLSIRDITGLMEREQSARHRVEVTSHLKDEFLALLSHELRTPLGAILVWLGLLRQGGFDLAEKERALEIIERSARSLERIIEDLLHASRIAAGGLMLHPQLVDLRGLVQVAVDSAAGDAAQKGVSMALIQGGPQVWVKGDPGRLQQVVSNLLSNAIKFTPTGGDVKVSLDVIDQQARLRVTDTGEGLSPAFLPFAFERFRQQDSTSTRAHHGLGLGLYVVRHVIGNHGGFVSAESPGPGRGSTFTVLLPQAASPVAESAPSAPRAASGDSDRLQGLKVLLVDDEEDAREAMRLILQQNGMTVITAASSDEGFDLLVSQAPDILLSDIAMPGEDGLSLVRRVRLLPRNQGGLIPAAALSAYAGVHDRRTAFTAGFQHHIAKPVDPARLLAVIATMAGKNETERS